MKRIEIISSYAQDVITNNDTQQKYERVGGPAYWIVNCFESLGQAFLLHTAFEKSLVNIIVKDGKETGQLVQAQEIPDYIQSDNVNDLCLVSTLGSEFNLYSLVYFKGKIAIDIQGYVRRNYFEDNLDINLFKNFNVFKATKEEFERLPHSLKKVLLDKILLITDGESGFSLVINNVYTKYFANKITTSDTIGAGDTLFASFCMQFVKTNDPYRSAKFALNTVEEFLINKTAPPK